MVRIALAALALSLSACTSEPMGMDAGSDAPPVPASCTACPNDCCLLPDGGAACMNYTTRNPVTMQCQCGSGPACLPPEACCPPNTCPAPQEAPTCVANSTLCDPRPTG